MQTEIPVSKKVPVVKLMMLLVPILLVSGCVVVPMSDATVIGTTAQVCHKGKKTLELPQPAIQAHLKHGDRLGPC